MNKEKRSFKDYILPAFMLISSVILLVVAVPRFLAELMLVPGTPLYESLSEGVVLSDEDLQVIEDSRLSALDFAKLPKIYTQLGMVYLLRANRAQTPQEQQDFARQSIEITQKGLSMAPLNTFAWARMASANIILGEDHFGEALKAWRTSVATARFEPFLLIQRVHIGTILYRQMTPKDIDLLKDQFQMTVRWNRGKLRAYARKNQLIPWMIFLANGDDETVKFFQN